MNPPTSDIPPNILALHVAYQNLTGYTVTLHWPRVFTILLP